MPGAEADPILRQSGTSFRAGEAASVESVLVVSQPGSDGVLRHVDLLCRFLIGRGIRLHLAYSDRQSCEQLYTLIKVAAAGGGRTLNLRTGKVPEPSDLPALQALWRLVREERPQVIHAHSSKAGGLVRMLPLLGVKSPIFYTPHAYYRMHDPGNWKARVFHGIERLLGKFGTTIGMGRSETDFAGKVLGIPSQRRTSISNGIDTELFYPVSPERKERLREKYGVPRGVALLGTVGRFSAQKDPATLYAALLRLSTLLPDLHFAHLGRGELEPEIDALLAGQPFAGRVTRIPYLADSSEFYQMLDGFILTSRYEGMSYAALEAFACGLPSILTDAPGNADFADFGFSQMWRPRPADVDSVVSAISAWHRDLQRKVGNNHRQVMLDHFTEEMCGGRILAAYRAALAVT